MKANVVKTYKIELSGDEVKSFLRMCDDIHEGKVYETTLLYEIEETLCSLMNM